MRVLPVLHRSRARNRGRPNPSLERTSRPVVAPQNKKPRTFALRSAVPSLKWLHVRLPGLVFAVA